MNNENEFIAIASKANTKCTDGRILSEESLAMNDGLTIPLVWNHQINDAKNIIGQAKLKYDTNTKQLMAKCKLLNNEYSKDIMHKIKNNILNAVSIAGRAIETSKGFVKELYMRELSVVLKGANKYAKIIQHSDDDNIIIQCTESEIKHSKKGGRRMNKQEEIKERIKSVIESMTEEQRNLLFYMLSETDNNSTLKQSDDIEDWLEELEMSDEYDEYLEQDDELTGQEIYDSMTKDQKEVISFLCSMVIQMNMGDDKDKKNIKQYDNSLNDIIDETLKEENEMSITHNVFEQEEKDINETKKTDIKHTIIEDMVKNKKSLKESLLEHSITDINKLFPEGKNVTGDPFIYSENFSWVDDVMKSTKKVPFSIIKSYYADLTADESRALGFLAPNKKQEEVFSILSRQTHPQTIYKLQKLSRDDIIQIKDFNIIGYLWKEMRYMLSNEVARSILFGDGRQISDQNKIKTDCIRPIATDDDIYTIKANLGVATSATSTEIVTAFLDQAVRSRKNYRGTGNPTLFIEDEILYDILLLKDNDGRYMYKDISEIKNRLMVKNIVQVPQMSNIIREDSNSKKQKLLGIIVNLYDYTIGSVKNGGEMTSFEDFDIDYNAYKYLLETNLCGALTVPKSAIVLEREVATSNAG